MTDSKEAAKAAKKAQRQKDWENTPLVGKIAAFAFLGVMAWFVMTIFAGAIHDVASWVKTSAADTATVSPHTPIITPTPKTPATTPSPKVSGTPTPSATPNDQAKIKQQAAAILSASTDHYEQLFNSGKQILGSTQYSDGYAGLAAMNDPSSAASKFSKFNQSMQQYDSNDVAAYNKASNLFSDPPTPIGDWNADINDADSDLHLWTQQAVSWQISSISSSQLTVAEQKFRDDIAKARADIASLAH